MLCAVGYGSGRYVLVHTHGPDPSERVGRAGYQGSYITGGKVVCFVLNKGTHHQADSLSTYKNYKIAR